jgi:hypothetical protein
MSTGFLTDQPKKRALIFKFDSGSLIHERQAGTYDEESPALPVFYSGPAWIPVIINDVSI